MLAEQVRSGGTLVTILQVAAGRTVVSTVTALRQVVIDTIERDGPVVLDGLGVSGPEAFREVVGLFGDPFGSYRGGNTPRRMVRDGIFTSTEYPAKYPISLHNELSYAHRWPDRLYFCCQLPARAGGTTPVCDGRAVLADLDGDILRRFETLGVFYHQHLHGGHGFGKSWQATFDTSDRAEVEQFLLDSGASFTWSDQGGLRVGQRRRAVLEHPRTGHPVWFNQAEQWHPSALPAGQADALRAVLNGVERDLPHSVAYGDGSPISLADLEHIREVVERHTVRIPWRAGNVMIVDNALTMHGRDAYEGDRRVLVAMT